MYSCLSWLYMIYLYYISNLHTFYYKLNVCIWKQTFYLYQNNCISDNYTKEIYIIFYKYSLLFGEQLATTL